MPLDCVHFGPRVDKRCFYTEYLQLNSNWNHSLNCFFQGFVVALALLGGNVEMVQASSCGLS